MLRLGFVLFQGRSFCAPEILHGEVPYDRAVASVVFGESLVAFDDQSGCLQVVESVLDGAATVSGECA